MSMARILGAVCIIALLGMAVFGCSDSGGEGAKNSAGLTNDGHDLLVFRRLTLFHFVA